MTKPNYTELMNQAAAKTGFQEVGETLEPLMKQIEEGIRNAVQKQYEKCTEKGFTLKKYYIHVFVTKDLHAANLWNAPNVLRIRGIHCRATRPSPYQDSDHYLWSVTNMDNIKLEWCIPNKETVNYILKNPNEFDVNYVNMLRRYQEDKLDDISDYLIDGEIK